MDANAKRPEIGLPQYYLMHINGGKPKQHLLYVMGWDMNMFNQLADLFNVLPRESAQQQKLFIERLAGHADRWRKGQK